MIQPDPDILHLYVRTQKIKLYHSYLLLFLGERGFCVHIYSRSQIKDIIFHFFGFENKDQGMCIFFYSFPLKFQSQIHIYIFTVIYLYIVILLSCLTKPFLCAFCMFQIFKYFKVIISHSLKQARWFYM